MSGYGQTSSTGAGGSGGAAVPEVDKPVQYVCGDCAFKVLLRRGDPIRCTDCGYRVLYKERTNR
jgi:DNA-directed RNA polymerase I, II, and III subunit RPABC4